MSVAEGRRTEILAGEAAACCVCGRVLQRHLPAWRCLAEGAEGALWCDGCKRDSAARRPEDAWERAEARPGVVRRVVGEDRGDAVPTEREMRDGVRRALGDVPPGVWSRRGRTPPRADVDDSLTQRRSGAEEEGGEG